MKDGPFFWVLGFDKANTIKLAVKEAVEKVVSVIWGNDLYQPRSDVDEDLLKELGKAYVKASQLVLENYKRERPGHELDEAIAQNSDWHDQGVPSHRMYVDCQCLQVIVMSRRLGEKRREGQYWSPHREWSLKL